MPADQLWLLRHLYTEVLDGRNVHLTDGETAIVHSPSDMPDRAIIESIEEPYIRATILCPKEFVGAVMELCQERRGTHVDMTFLSQQRVQLHYDIPLAEIVLDFFDQLKSRTKGYASLDYELIGERPSDLVKMDIMINVEPVDAFACRARQPGRAGRAPRRVAAWRSAGGRLLRRVRTALPGSS